MKTIGLTGGIGSGKSTVAAIFARLGVPVYIADDRARSLTNEDPQIRREIMDLLGERSYTEQGLDREYVASKVFGDEALLSRLNNIIHPRVRADFDDWKQQQLGPYCIMEAAILFENEGYKRCDLTVLVSAPRELRIKRVMERDRVEREAVEARMRHQWPDSKKRELADFVIDNIDLKTTEEQVEELHRKFSENP